MMLFTWQHALHPASMGSLSSVTSSSLLLQFHCRQRRGLPTVIKFAAGIRASGCSITKPRLPEHNNSIDNEATIPRFRKTLQRAIKEAGSNDGNNNSSDVLCLMGSLGFPVTPDIYASLIDECTRKGDAYQALELWAHMERNKPMMRFLTKPKGSTFIKRILVMLMSCGCVDATHQLFDKMPERDFVVWCLMIAGLVDNSLHSEALDMFSQMTLHPLVHQSDAVPQTLFSCLLKACIHDMNMDIGRTLHGWAMKLGYTKDLIVSTAFLNFYGKFGCTHEANLLLWSRTEEGGDTVLWTGAISSNCSENLFEDTILMFRDMSRAGIRKNEYTLSSVLRACARIQDGGQCGQQAHAEAVKLGLVDSHVFVQCGLVDMYAKCGKLVNARKVFDSISCKRRIQSAPCWSAMINGYLEKSLYVDAVKTLYQMKASGVEPQESLLQRVRIACGTSGLER